MSRNSEAKWVTKVNISKLYAELGFAAEEIGIKGSPTVTVDSFQPETKRSAKMLTGTPAELAKQLYDLIEEEKGK